MYGMQGVQGRQVLQKSRQQQDYTFVEVLVMPQSVYTAGNACHIVNHCRQAHQTPTLNTHTNTHTYYIPSHTCTPTRSPFIFSEVRLAHTYLNSTDIHKSNDTQITSRGGVGVGTREYTARAIMQAIMQAIIIATMRISTRGEQVSYGGGFMTVAGYSDTHSEGIDIQEHRLVNFPAIIQTHHTGTTSTHQPWFTIQALNR